MTTGKELEPRVEVLPVAAPRMTAQAITEHRQQITLMQSLVRDLLVPGIDYGLIPGTKSDSLLDSGANAIFTAFNCYPGERRIIRFIDDGRSLAICIEVPIIDRLTGRTVGSGVGASSSLEAKHKYRWSDDPRKDGYDEESIKLLKTRGVSNNKTQWKVLNTEQPELLNTILKMASKRAEVDAAASMPGVSTVLKQLWGQGIPAKTQPAPVRQEKAAEASHSDSTRYDRFWGEINRMGYTPEQARKKVGTSSFLDWEKSGHSLEEAITILRGEDEPAAETE
ncbi:hypothetical protein LCGC14_0632280 [marine sediment metagenome]|uniref:Uncharacterized protein n=1 Tax=marine sediment metagenome TaxID=412755 RepID=A0A0F9UA64_9ZZZZ